MVHPAISVGSGDKTDSPFVFDVTMAPPDVSNHSNPSARGSPPTWNTSSPTFHSPPLPLGEDATEPPSNRIYLISDLIPQGIKVEGKKGVEGGTVTVTVYHIWKTLHEELREPLTKYAWNFLTEGDQERLFEGFRLRLDGIQNNCALRKQQFEEGPKLLDFLRGKTEFLGMSASSRQVGHFTMSLGTPVKRTSPTPNFTLNLAPPAPPSTSTPNPFRTSCLPDVEDGPAIQSAHFAISIPTDGTTTRDVFDVAIDPAVFRNGSIPLSTPWGENATRPPLNFIYLHSDLFPRFFTTAGLTRCIKVTGTLPSVGGTFLSVGVLDVWETLYNKLQEPITMAEWPNLSNDTRKYLFASRDLRLSRIQNVSSREQQGRAIVKWLDFMCGHTVLLGMSADSKQLGHFTLHWRSQEVNREYEALLLRLQAAVCFDHRDA